MFSFIKSLFRESPAPASVLKSSTPAARDSEKSPVFSRPVPPPPSEISKPSEPRLDVPLHSIVERLPAELRAKVARQPKQAETVGIPLASTLEQLPRGAVRIPFGDLKKAAPDVFANGSDCDSMLVEVPLKEVLARLKPIYLARRAQQKAAPLPEGVDAVFTARPSPGAKRRASEPAPGPRLVQLPESPAAPRPGPALPHESASVKPPPSVPTPAPGPAPKPVAPPLPPFARRATAAAPAPATPDPKTKLSADAQEPVKMPLVPLTRSWPEAMRREILGTYLTAAVHIPMAELEAALKHGKVVFTWKQLRLWMSPKPAATLSEFDAVGLELPLAIVTPAFLARRSRDLPQKKLAAAADIPNVFSPRKAAEPAAEAKQEHGVSPEAHAPHALAGDNTQAPATPHPSTPRMTLPGAPGAAALDHLTMTRSSALPLETVRRACHLSGVSGALIATLDGLIVASQLPTVMNGEKAAGFLPQVFSRLSQYARELRLGEPSQVEMLVESVPVLISRTHNVYFAVLGKAAEPLPKAQLHALANQLSGRTS